MNAKQRMIALRLVDRQRKNPALFESLGVNAFLVPAESHEILTADEKRTIQ